MLLSIGNMVRFVHTGTQGKIVDRLEDGLFIVEVGDGVEIPAFPEHLVRLDADLSSVKARIVKGKSEPEKKTFPLAKPQYEILKNEGIQFAFELMKEGSMQRYGVYMINDTLYQALYELEIIIKNKSIKKVNGKVEPNSVLKIMEMPADYLSDNPLLDISCRQISTEGMTDWLRKELKLKPKQFFARKKTAPLLGRQAHVYKIFEPYQLKNKEESLRNYTKKQIIQKPIVENNNDLYQEWTYGDVKKFANFPIEKDLHVEKLIEDSSKMSNGEIIKLQLKIFEEYLDEAIKLGVPRVFVIHGKGKGKLKNEIATILMQIPDVKTFKNEYHPKYSTGATEIIFK